jgi:hypothetical protein
VVVEVAPVALVLLNKAVDGRQVDQPIVALLIQLGRGVLAGGSLGEEVAVAQATAKVAAYMSASLIFRLLLSGSLFRNSATLSSSPLW